MSAPEMGRHALGEEFDDRRGVIYLDGLAKDVPRDKPGVLVYLQEERNVCHEKKQKEETRRAKDKDRRTQ